MDTPFTALDGLGSRSPRLDAESPKEGCRRHTFDEAIETKAHEGNAISSLACPERHDPFHDVIGHGSADQPKTDALPITYGGRPGHKRAVGCWRGIVHGSSFRSFGRDLFKVILQGSRRRC